jgi:hypothetical protein
MQIPGDSASPIKDFIQSALTQIKEAIPADARIDGIIKIEMSTVVQKGEDGRLEIGVIPFGADVHENQVQKITIPIQILTNSAIAQNAAIIARAESEKAQAESEKYMAEIKNRAMKKSLEGNTGSMKVIRLGGNEGL